MRDDQIVQLTCHNPGCVLSGHLTLGTRESVHTDKLNRMQCSMPDAPLTEDEREYIRALVDDHGGTVTDASHDLGGVHWMMVRKGLRLGREAWERSEFVAFLTSFMPLLHSRSKTA